MGFSVIVFRFKTKAILGLTVDNLPTAIQEVVNAVKRYETSTNNSNQAIVIGTSMGSVFAWHTASRVPSIRKIVINTGYALISKHIFEDKVGKPWRKTLLAQGIDEQSFHKLIKEHEPLTVIKSLTDKDVLLFLNKDDNVISFSNSVLMKKELEKNKISHRYVENKKMRHGTTILRNLHSKHLVEFLET